MYIVCGQKLKKEGESFTELIKRITVHLRNAFELYYGARRSANPEKAVLEVSNLLNFIGVLEFDNSAAQKAGDIHANLMNSGNPIDIMDVLIAGIVLANKEELLTRDIEHFDRIKGLRCRTW